MNTNELDSIYIGSSEVTRLYNGGTLVWEKDTPIGITWEMGINLSRQNNDTPDTVPNWNNVRPPQGAFPANTSFSNLVDINAVNRNVTLTAVTGADSANWLGPPAFPYPAPQSYYAAWFNYGSAGITTFKLSGLDNSKTYSLRFHSGDESSIGQVVTRITIGSETVNLYISTGIPSTADFDDPAYGSFNDIVPVGGEITFTVQKQGSEDYWALMGIRIREYGQVDPPGPSPASFRAVYNNDPENTSPFGYYEFKPEGHDSSGPNNKYPLVISFHGSDEAGNGNSGELSRVLNWGIPKMCNNGTFTENFIALSPQYSIPQAYDASLISDFIDYAKQTYKVDEERIYLTGMSAGGMYALYYLQEYTSNHGIAAMVPISAPGESGYTDTSLIAASGCPQWWMSNIGDPIAPWQTDGGGYISILNVVNGINAVDPNVVEKLTGFNNSTHDGTWDGIYNSSLIGTANPSYDPFDESIYDWMMGHTYNPSPPEPPSEEMVELTVNVTGVSDPEIIINNEVVPSNILLFPKDTSVNGITPTSEGYTFSPASANVNMDESKSITFTATPL